MKPPSLWTWTSQYLAAEKEKRKKTTALMEAIAATANAPESSDPVVGRLNDWLEGMGVYALRVCKTGALRCSPAPTAACWPIGETCNADRCTCGMHHPNIQRLCVPYGVSKVAEAAASSHLWRWLNGGGRGRLL